MLEELNRKEIGFGSESAVILAETNINKSFKAFYDNVFELNTSTGKVSKPSGMSLIDTTNANISFDDYLGKYKDVVSLKVSFIKSNKFSCFFESDLNLAILLAKEFPELEILFVSESEIISVKSSVVAGSSFKF